ncbi:MAG TPA: TIGR03960 family B12-binding radical SAM protein [Candidatus Atribacteria bacterium]|nr:TIGR03960 family B12-binding radical SAM protein [Candidatus Atribacteria bacterium]HPT62650.1 TIGR03960 family B12-binding radical SAM protein [Candidatus Atribacteria bacterium]HPZ39442.1 TIGR03960 family B12-binding radical SAM protein [Candidatus Atribacteria bacterium]
MDLEKTLSRQEMLSISKPARYIGREWNISLKKEEDVEISVALAFPDLYEIGMSHLGLKILYYILNSLPGVRAERAFAPWPDMGKMMKEKNIPLYSLENKIPLRNFDAVGISLQHELNYTNVLYLLDLAGIPLRSEERGEEFPLILGGGPCAFNPEPVSPFFDVFLLGEGEEAIVEIVEILRVMKGEKRSDVLSELAKIEGCYVPLLYSVSYHPDGKIKNISPSRVVRKRWVKNLDGAPYPQKIIVPYLNIVHDRIPLEIARGCTRGCRFCQAGMIYRPHRERSPEKVIELAEKLVKSTGYEEVSLLSLSSTDYSAIEYLVRDLSFRLKESKVNVSLPSLRMDAFSVEVAQSLQEVRRSGLTFAPEAGSERLRRVINKGLTDEDIFQTVEKTFSSGWREVKLYFMIGLPGEREEDIRDIANLVKEILGRGKKKGVHLGISAFIPKSHTPFQWTKQEEIKSLEEKMAILHSLLRPLGRRVRYNWSDFEVNLVEGALSRGDRRISSVIERVYRKGGVMDNWREFFSLRRWQEGFEEEGLDLDFYTHRERDREEIFPWEHLSPGVSKDFLWKEYQLSQEEKITPPCQEGKNCYNCGVC